MTALPFVVVIHFISHLFDENDMQTHRARNKREGMKRERGCKCAVYSERISHERAVNIGWRG
jgi:hypothetical protein